MKKINVCRKIEIKYIEKGVSLDKFDIVLDIGSGDGYWTNYFAGKCSEITGVEPYEEHFRLAKKKYSDKCKFVWESAEALSFERDTFDKVISICVFEHLYDDKSAFNEIFRVIKPGGKLCATVDSLNSPYVPGFHKKTHVKECYVSQLYTIESVASKLNEAGFKKIRANYIIGSRLGVMYEMLSEKIGALCYLIFLPLYPLIMLLEKKQRNSGYKIFVSAEKN